MRIAVAYDNGNIFQHFGRTEEFKLYDVEDGTVVSSEVVGSGGAGHGALAGVLAQNSVDILICGGMGQGAQNALTEAGIRVCTGAEGDADAAVAAFLRGELENKGVNCDHHDHEHGEDHVCGDHGCGHEQTTADPCGGCTGCDGAAGAFRLMFEAPNAGKLCKVHYVGTLDDGSQFDSSYERNQPLEFLCAAGEMIPGFDYAVGNMQPGEIIDVHLTADEAYGMPNDAFIITVEIASVEGSEELGVGDRAQLYDQLGRPFVVTVTAKDDTLITFDANHELAGKDLNFKIELLEVKDYL